MLNFTDLMECDASSPAHDFTRARGKDIILIGMMGCGKSTVGRMLSIDLERPLLDMDALIEDQIGKSISDIFRDEGEGHFRSLETALLRFLADGPPSPAEGCILSTGGGVPIKPENRDLLRKLGFVVWLRVDVDTLYERTCRASHRPLLNHGGSARQRLKELCELRYPIYEETAHYIIDTSEVDVNVVTDWIKSAAEKYFS